MGMFFYRGYGEDNTVKLVEFVGGSLLAVRKVLTKLTGAGQTMFFIAYVIKGQPLITYES